MLQNKAIEERMGVLETVRRQVGDKSSSVLLIAPAALLSGDFMSSPPPTHISQRTTARHGSSPRCKFRHSAYQGKEAVQAMIYTADGGATKFVGYLLRYTAEGKLKMKIRLSDPKAEMVPIPPEWTEVKRPGSGWWTPGTGLFSAELKGRVPGSEYSDIVTVTGPNKGPAVPVGAD